jgi:small nuclear ribonucleoprotein (snRNP)-like protein
LLPLPETDRGSKISGPLRRPAMLDEYVGEKVVIDLKSPFVCLGTLVRFDDHFLELKAADFHDLRDTDTSRENYVAASVATGIKRNRKKVLLVRADVIAVSRLADVSFE